MVTAIFNQKVNKILLQLLLPIVMDTDFIYIKNIYKKIGFSSDISSECFIKLFFLLIKQFLYI